MKKYLIILGLISGCSRIPYNYKQRLIAYDSGLYYRDIVVRLDTTSLDIPLINKYYDSMMYYRRIWCNPNCSIEPFSFAIVK